MSEIPFGSNLVICISGVGANTPFSCLISDCIPDLGMVGTCQCLPLYLYEEVETESAQPQERQLSLF